MKVKMTYEIWKYVIKNIELFLDLIKEFFLVNFNLAFHPGLNGKSYLIGSEEDFVKLFLSV